MVKGFWLSVRSEGRDKENRCYWGLGASTGTYNPWGWEGSQVWRFGLGCGVGSWVYRCFVGAYSRDGTG